MSLQKLQDSFNDIIFETVDELKQHISNYIKFESETYQKNKTNRALHFGKYKGYTVKELALTEKGAQYIQWLLSQDFFTEDKYQDLYEDIKAAKILKKKTKRVQLE